MICRLVVKVVIGVDTVVDRRVRWRDEVSTRGEVGVSNREILWFVMINPEFQMAVEG